MSDGINVQVIRYKYNDLTPFKPGKLIEVQEGNIVLWCPYCQEIYVVRSFFVKDISRLTMSIPVRHSTVQGLCEYWLTEGYTRPTAQHDVGYTRV